MPKLAKPVLAGFFIGDGSQSKRGIISFTQKDPTILLAIQRMYGGWIRTVNHGQAYRLTLRKVESQRFIKDCGHWIRPWRDIR